MKEAVWENSPKPCLKSPGRPFFAFLALGPLQTAGIPTWFCPFEAHLSCLQAIRSIPTVQTRQKKRDMHPATQAPDTLFPALFPSTWNFPVFSGRGSVSRFEGAPPYPVFFTAPFSAARWAPPPSKRSPPEAPRGNSPTPVRPSLSFIVTSPWETVKRPLVPPASSIPQRGLSIPQRGNHPPLPKAPLPLAKENFSWYGLGY